MECWLSKIQSCPAHMTRANKSMKCTTGMWRCWFHTEQWCRAVIWRIPLVTSFFTRTTSENEKLCILHAMHVFGKKGRSETARKQPTHTRLKLLYLKGLFYCNLHYLRSFMLLTWSVTTLKELRTHAVQSGKSHCDLLDHTGPVLTASPVQETSLLTQPADKFHCLSSVTGPHNT